MSPAKNGNKVRLQASLNPLTWEWYQQEADRRTGGNISALLELIAAERAEKVNTKNTK